MLFGMSLYDWLAQGVGIFAMAFNILSYQQKKSRDVIAFQLFGGALFALNFLMISAPVGCMMNLIAVFRAIVFVNKEKLRADRVAWFVFFLILYGVSYLSTFLFFGTAFNLKNALIEILPVIGLVATTVSFRFKDAAMIRKFAWISSPCWLVYNVIHFTAGGIICEALSIISVIVGTLRLDKKKGEN